MALYENTCVKDCMAFRMPVQPSCGGAITSRLPPIRLQKQRVGEPHRPLSIVLRTLPCEEPVFGRRSRGRVARLQLRDGEGKKKVRCSPRLGGTRQYRPGLCAPAHDTLPVPDPSRRIASTVAMRSPIQRMTGTAIELPRALYRGLSAAGLLRYSTSV
jgi:hypothetical protein